MLWLHPFASWITETKSKNKTQRSRTKLWNIYFNLRAAMTPLQHLVYDRASRRRKHPFFRPVVRIDFWMPYLIPDRHWISLTPTPQQEFPSRCLRCRLFGRIIPALFGSIIFATDWLLFSHFSFFLCLKSIWKWARSHHSTHPVASPHHRSIQVEKRKNKLREIKKNIQFINGWH